MPAKTKRRPSTEQSSVGTRKTSFMLDEEGRSALRELRQRWRFRSDGHAVGHALMYLLHQTKAGAIRRLPVREE